MKQLVFASLILAVISCNAFSQTKNYNTSEIKIVSDTATLDGKWQLMPVLASDTATGKIPTITFNLATKKFFGNTGCNTMNGSFEIKQDAFKFSENITSTKMACQGFNEKSFVDNLIKVNRYEIKNGVLQLMYNTTVLSQWTRSVNTNPTKQI